MYQFDISRDEVIFCTMNLLRHINNLPLLKKFAIDTSFYPFSQYACYT